MWTWSLRLLKIDKCISNVNLATLSSPSSLCLLRWPFTLLNVPWKLKFGGMRNRCSVCKGFTVQAWGPEFGSSDPMLKSWAGWQLLVIPAPGKQRQEESWDSLANQSSLISSGESEWETLSQKETRWQWCSRHTLLYAGHQLGLICT